MLDWPMDECDACLNGADMEHPLHTCKCKKSDTEHDDDGDDGKYSKYDVYRERELL